MQAPSVSVSQLHDSKPIRSIRALALLLLAGAALVSLAPQARADDGRVILSTGLGAVAGVLIGQSVGGRNATIVGGAIGAAVGASAASQGGYQRGGPSVGYSNGYYPGGYATPVVYTQHVQVYRPAPVYQPRYQAVYQPVYRSVMRPVIYPAVVYGGYREGYGSQYDSDDRADRRNRGWDGDRGNSGYGR